MILEWKLEELNGGKSNWIILKMDKKQLKIISANINGLISPRKRKRTFLQLKKIKCRSNMSTETYIKRLNQKLLENKTFGKLFTSTDSNKKKKVW